jgi:GntR family transcriptional regulator, arabinose operon transcriptional repressor
MAPFHAGFGRGRMTKTARRIPRTRSSSNGHEPEEHKYQLIFDNLQQGISSGRYAPGSRLPSELELVRRFDVCRVTAAKAIKKLQQLGLVERRVGSGTYVKAQPADSSRLFGLLIPELGQTEIFEPICRGMAGFPLASRNSLLWGQSIGVNEPKEQIAEELCQQYISEGVSGVFFAPLELVPGMDEVNRKIAAMLDRARIPVVLLDRCFMQYPGRSRYDLVGIDNRRTSFAAVEHLVKTGAKRIAFLGKPYSAQTVDARIAGYREALLAHGLNREGDLVFRCDPEDVQQIRRIFKRHRPHAFLCANDHTAANLMRTLIALGVSIPETVKIVGIDDVRYASLLPIPLTTQHQPCVELGRVAMATMINRLESADLPVRDISLQCRLVVRKSCGSQQPKA